MAAVHSEPFPSYTAKPETVAFALRCVAARRTVVDLLDAEMPSSSLCRGVTPSLAEAWRRASREALDSQSPRLSGPSASRRGGVHVLVSSFLFGILARPRLVTHRPVHSAQKKK